jgi:hypothetical protein
MAILSSADLEELQAFLKDWLRHSGRTQADLRRALHAASIRMPVLLDVLQRTYSQHGLAGLAEQLCDIEARWQSEDQGGPEAGGGDDPEGGLGQLDLLLQEIRQERQP